MPTSRPMKTQDNLGEILDCYTDVDELKDEMETWRDGMPDSLQSSDKYDQVSTAADTLESAYSELEESCDGIKKILEKIPKGQDEMSILDKPIEYIEHKMYKGYQMPRWVRLANPCAALGAAMEFLEGLFDSISKDLDNDEDTDLLKEFMKQVTDALSDLDSVDFPSMYG